MSTRNLIKTRGPWWPWNVLEEFLLSTVIQRRLDQSITFLYSYFQTGPMDQVLFRSGGRFVQQSRTSQRASSEIFVCNYFEFVPVVQEEMSFKDIPYLQL